MTRQLQSESAGRARTPAWARLFLAIFLCAWCGNQFSPLLVLYARVDHYSAFIVDSFLGVYVLGLAPALLLAGPLSDRHGRRPLMTVGVLTAVAASASLALGPIGPAPIYLGRLLSGVTVGIAMAVGASWLKELSQAPHEPAADRAAGARRASLAFTLGSGSGAVVAGLIAQFTPFGETLPFLVHALLALAVLPVLRTLPETAPGGIDGPFREQLRIPGARHPRFTRVVALTAPWVFVAVAVSYGYLPVLLAPVTGRFGLLYATLLTAVALGVAALVQPIAKRLHSPLSARALLVSLGVIVIGIALVALAALTGSLLLGVLANVVIGAAMGIALVSGLLEVQTIAGRRGLASLTGLFYAVSYAGFLAPTALSALASFASPVLLLAVTAALCLGALGVVARSSRRYLEPPAEQNRSERAGAGAPSA